MTGRQERAAGDRDEADGRGHMVTVGRRPCRVVIPDLAFIPSFISHCLLTIYYVPQNNQVNLKLASPLLLPWGQKLLGAKSGHEADLIGGWQVSGPVFRLVGSFGKLLSLRILLLGAGEAFLPPPGHSAFLLAFEGQLCHLGEPCFSEVR